MFPILDARGRIVSFGGRAMNPDDRAKYLNGPESPLFHKGATLYGLPEARRILGAESKNDQAIIVVEGYMDVIACQRAGLPAVAPMGTAVTEEQMERLWRVSSRADPVLRRRCGGTARRLSRHRTLAAAAEARALVPVLRCSGAGQDPDDILRDKGAPALRQALAETHGFAEVLFRREQDRGAAGHARAEGRLQGAAAEHSLGYPGQGSGRTIPPRPVRPFRRPVPPQPPTRALDAGAGQTRFRPAAQAGSDGGRAPRRCSRCFAPSSPCRPLWPTAPSTTPNGWTTIWRRLPPTDSATRGLDGLAQELVRLRLSGR